jgi:hypothetical protein
VAAVRPVHITALDALAIALLGGLLMMAVGVALPSGWLFIAGISTAVASAVLAGAL